MNRLTAETVAIVQPLIEGGPHREPERAWWWPLVQQLAADGLLVVDNRRQGRGAVLAWTQRGRASIETAQAPPAEVAAPARRPLTREDLQAWCWTRKLHADGHGFALTIYGSEDDPRVSVKVSLDRRTRQETRTFQLGDELFEKLGDLLRALNALDGRNASP